MEWVDGWMDRWVVYRRRKWEKWGGGYVTMDKRNVGDGSKYEQNANGGEQGCRGRIAQAGLNLRNDVEVIDVKHTKTF